MSGKKFEMSGEAQNNFVYSGNCNFPGGFTANILKWYTDTEYSTVDQEKNASMK